jgi:hypothetical protein
MMANEGGGGTGMKPTKCLQCQGAEFYHSHLAAHTGVFVRRGTFGEVPILCSICLNCGNVHTYLDKGGLMTVRAWHAEDTHGK